MAGAWARKVLRLTRIRALVTVPGLIALGIWALAVPILWLQNELPPDSLEWLSFLDVSVDTRRALLGTIASAAITVMGLVYSIVLLVFTTAAANIGPRLLQRFTGDRINQMTAGLLGGTFLYAMTVLHQTDKSSEPRLALTGAAILTVLCVLQLIRFVGSAATSVTVDEEVAEISRQLEEEIERIVADEDQAPLPGTMDVPRHGGDRAHWLRAQSAGYVAHLDAAALADALAGHDVRARLLHGTGDFVVPGQRLVRLDRPLEDDALESLEASFESAMTLGESRTPQEDVSFAINLLVEIALRALSPGVNDTFTAIVCVDRLSSALVRPVRDGLRHHVVRDGEDRPRLILPGETLEELLDTAIAPMRRAARGNLMMTDALLRALGRLLEVARDEVRPVLREHMRLLMDRGQEITDAEDRGTLRARYRELLRL